MNLRGPVRYLLGIAVVHLLLKGEWKNMVFLVLCCFPSPLLLLLPLPPFPHPFPVSSIPYLKSRWRAETSASSPDDLGQGLKHCHKSAAHFNATLRQCERLVSVAPALFLYGLLWLFFIKRPCGVIFKFLSVCWQVYGPFCRVQELWQACETSDIKMEEKCQAEGIG